MRRSAGASRVCWWRLVFILGSPASVPGSAGAGPLTADQPEAVRLLQLDGQDLLASQVTLAQAIEDFFARREAECESSQRLADFCISRRRWRRDIVSTGSTSIRLLSHRCCEHAAQFIALTVRESIIRLYRRK